MGKDIAEIVGLFVVIVGVCLVVAAAASVSWALACLVAGVFLIFGGTLAVYVAAKLSTADRRPS